MHTHTTLQSQANLTFMATTASGSEVKTNLTEDAINAVAWGTFPGVLASRVSGVADPQTISCMNLCSAMLCLVVCTLLCLQHGIDLYVNLAHAQAMR